MAKPSIANAVGIIVVAILAAAIHRYVESPFAAWSALAALLVVFVVSFVRQLIDAKDLIMLTIEVPFLPSREFLFAGRATFIARLDASRIGWSIFALAKDKMNGPFLELVFTVKHMPKTDRFPARYFVYSRYSGQSRSSDRFIGILIDCENSGLQLYDSIKVPISAKTEVFAFRYCLNQISRPPILNVEFFHDGKCGRCRKSLIDIDSITRGIGPECWRHIHGRAT